ncbi:protein of unknown function [Magnetospirillum sp. XM-1]|nr:hypothetical protein [Magnetospirillum sp. XM-1]CUW41107.1 protein of unknown function [Magnetospirillum sp. XM-1]
MRPLILPGLAFAVALVVLLTASAEIAAEIEDTAPSLGFTHFIPPQP